MTLKTQLNDSVREAMKSGDEIRKRTVRMVLAAVKQAEVDKRVELDDTAVMGLIQKEVKNRRESLEEARKANRADLVEANEAEIQFAGSQGRRLFRGGQIEKVHRHFSGLPAKMWL